MENASKALIMAGSVLIALMILGALLLMFNNLNNYQNTESQNTREAQVVEFNNQYETYNRNNVRGSDLCSLLNRVADYNRRKSTEGTGKNDEGQYLAYEPMTIEFDFSGKREQLKVGDKNNLIMQEKYSQSNKENQFEEYISSKIGIIEENYGTDVIQKLATSVSKIYVDENASYKTKMNAVLAYNSIKGKKLSIENDSINQSIKEINASKNDVYTYYEYMQFKRAYFNCESVEYSKKTGRITKMYFKFNGTIE